MSLKLITILLVFISVNINAQECIDIDGDGWGWTGTESCLVENTQPAEQPAEHPSGQPSEPMECVDPDGDGWGWNGVSSCTAQNPTGNCDYSAASQYGGWGWNPISHESCPPMSKSVCIDPDGDGWGWNGISSCSLETTVEGTTRVVLSAGQSNAENADTVYDATLDAPLDNMIVWTSYDGWQPADLCTHVWDDSYFPANNGMCNNHLGFQVAKQMAILYPDSTIALIPTGEPGQPISQWLGDNFAGNELFKKTRTALNALVGVNKVDLIAFAQGESDEGNELWTTSINALLQEINETDWFTPAGRFIVPETAFPKINQQIRALGDSSSSSQTGFVSVVGLETKDGVHWNAPSLRELGLRIVAAFRGD